MDLRLMEWCARRRWTGIVGYAILSWCLPMGWPFLIGIAVLIFVDIRSYVSGMQRADEIWLETRRRR